MAGVFWVVARVLDGVEVIGNPDAPLGEAGTWLWIALIFALVNAIVGPILRLLSLPFVLLTLGLFLLLVNAALLGITAALTDRLQVRSEEHTSELQSRQYLVCRLLLEKKKKA